MSTIPETIIQQLNLPVSFDQQGRTVTLWEFVKDKKNESLSFSSLTSSQRAEITVERIKRKPILEISTIRAGVISKDQAIAEVNSQTELGQLLVEAEQHLIERLVEEARSGRLKEVIDG